MTRQNAIHRYVREREQDRKKLLRKFSGKKIPYPNRKWWKAWHRSWESERLRSEVE